MAARVGTVLSDEHILKECAHYRPIPMKLANKMIDGTNENLNVESPWMSKKLKYQRQMSRPEHFDSYAHSLSRNLGNDPEFRGKLHAAYTADVAQHHNDVPEAPQNHNVPDAFFMNNVLPILQGLREGPLNPNVVPPAANENENENVAPPPPPPPNVYDFGADPEPEDDNEEEVPPLEDEDENEGPPPLEEKNVPLEESFDSGPSLQLPGNKKMRVRETQFLPKPLPKANVSGMKLRSGTQLQGPSQKRQQGLGPNDAQFPTTKMSMSTTDPFDNPVRISDIETQKVRKALFTYEQQRLASQKRQQLLGPNDAYFL